MEVFQLNILYYEDPIGVLPKNSIFLAGPTPRDEDVKSWRPEALRILEQDLAFTGTVVVPEHRNGMRPCDDMHKPCAGGNVSVYGWERSAMLRVGAIVFWVDRWFDPTRESLGMPAFTTDIEFGRYMETDPDRCFYGHPPGARKIHYLDEMYAEKNIHNDKKYDRGPDLSLRALLAYAKAYLISLEAPFDAFDEGI